MIAWRSVQQKENREKKRGYKESITDEI